MNDDTMTQRQAISAFRHIADRLIDPCPGLFDILETEQNLRSLTTVVPLPMASPLEFEVNDLSASAPSSGSAVRRFQEVGSTNVSAPGTKSNNESINRQSASSKYESLRSVSNRAKTEFPRPSSVPGKQLIQTDRGTRPGNAPANVITPVISFARRENKQSVSNVNKERSISSDIPNALTDPATSREAMNASPVTQPHSLLGAFSPVTDQQHFENDLPKPMQLMEKLIDVVDVQPSQTSKGQPESSSSKPFPTVSAIAKGETDKQQPIKSESRNRTDSISSQNSNPVPQINNERIETPIGHGRDSFTSARPNARISNWTDDELSSSGAMSLVDQLADEIISREKAYNRETTGVNYPIVREQIVTPIDRSNAAADPSDHNALSTVGSKSDFIPDWPASGRSALTENTIIQQTQKSSVKNINVTDSIDADSIASMINDILIEQARRHGVDIS